MSEFMTSGVAKQIKCPNWLLYFSGVPFFSTYSLQKLASDIEHTIMCSHFGPSDEKNSPVYAVFFAHSNTRLHSRRSCIVALLVRL